MFHTPERLRQAREALARSEHRRAIQLCEQVRANERVSDAQLYEIFGLLGCAHVGVGEHEAALSFLKRATPDKQTLAAAREAYEALGKTGDPAAHFEQAATRGKRAWRRRVGGLIAAAVALPVILGCCLCTYPCAGGMWSASQMADSMRAAREEGAARGRLGTIADCEQTLLARTAASAADPSGDAEWTIRLAASLSFDGCLSTTTGWDAYCADVPPANTHDGRDMAWANARCEAFATAQGMSAAQAEDFGNRCRPALIGVPVYCSDPAMRPSEESLGDDDEGYGDEGYDY